LLLTFPSTRAIAEVVTCKVDLTTPSLISIVVLPELSPFEAEAVSVQPPFDVVGGVAGRPPTPSTKVVTLHVTACARGIADRNATIVVAANFNQKFITEGPPLRISSGMR
jgi:hypothetical protein